MSSACQCASVGVDARVRIHPSYANLYKWAKSDAEFVRTLATAAAVGGTSINSPNTRRLGPNPAPVVDSYSCRQKFLRSYTFSRKETVPEKTAKCFGKVKERATELPCARRQRSCRGDNSGRFSMLSRGVEDYRAKEGPIKRKRRSLFLSIFHRLLSCMVRFDVADGDSVVHAL